MSGALLARNDIHMTMKLACSKLLKMHVYTTSGKHVGKIKDISFDLDSGMIKEYLVHSLLQKSYTIAREQVVRYEEDRIIVDDMVSIDEESRIATPLAAPLDSASA